LKSYVKLNKTFVGWNYEREGSQNKRDKDKKKLLIIAEPGGKARQRNSIAKQIWQPIDPRNFGCDVIVT